VAPPSENTALSFIRIVQIDLSITQRDEIFKQKVNDCVQHIILQKFTNFHAIRSWNFRIFAKRSWPRFFAPPCMCRVGLSTLLTFSLILWLFICSAECAWTCPQDQRVFRGEIPWSDQWKNASTAGGLGNGQQQRFQVISARSEPSVTLHWAPITPQVERIDSRNIWPPFLTDVVEATLP